MNIENEDGNIVADFPEAERKDLLAKRDDIADFFTILSDQLDSLEGKIAENQEILRDLSEIKESTLQIKDRFLNSTSTDYNLLSKISKQLESLIHASNQYAQKHTYLVVEFTQRENPRYDPASLINSFKAKYILIVTYRKNESWIKKETYNRNFGIEFLIPAILSNFGEKGWEVIESCKEINKWFFLMKQTRSFTKELLESQIKLPGEDDEFNLLSDD